MSKKKLSIREQSKLLVQSILNQQTLSANKILQKLILEAQLQRERIINQLILQQDDDLDMQDDGQDLDAEDTEDDADAEEGDEDSEQSGDDLDGQEQETSEADVDNKVDDTLQILCQINAKRIAGMADTIAALKQALQQKGLDVNSKEYIKNEVSITYYSDKLQEFQGKTNPGTDQATLEVALDKIFEALEQLKQQLGVQDSSSVDTDIDTPEEAGGNVDDEESGESEESEDEDMDEDEDMESEEDTDEDLDEESDEDLDEESDDEEF